MEADNYATVEVHAAAAAIPAVSAAMAAIIDAAAALAPKARGY